MGGISPEQDALAWIAMMITVLCWLTLPFWLGFGAAVVCSSRTNPECRIPPTAERSAGGIGSLVFAGLTVLGWAAVLPFTQREQILVHRVEQAYRTSGPAAALKMMSAQKRSDFPPDWQPPPRQFPGEPPFDEVLNMLEALAQEPHPAWVDDIYSRRFQDRARQDFYEWSEVLLKQHAVRLGAILPRLPRGAEMAKALQDPIPSIDRVLNGDRLEPSPRLSEDQRAALETLLRLAGEEKVESKSPPSAAGAALQREANK
jgi:hypothetical protein